MDEWMDGFKVSSQNRICWWTDYYSSLFSQQKSLIWWSRCTLTSSEQKTQRCWKQTELQFFSTNHHKNSKSDFFLFPNESILFSCINHGGPNSWTVFRVAGSVLGFLLSARQDAAVFCSAVRPSAVIPVHDRQNLLIAASSSVRFHWWGCSLLFVFPWTCR